MQMADLEAAFIGNLARYCMAMGTVPFKPRRGFYWVNGECRGMKCAMIEDEFDFHGRDNGLDVLAPIQEMVNHLRVHVGAILTTEGVGHILEAGKYTRHKTFQMFPQEDDNWLTEHGAIEYTGRTVQTLREWRRSRSVGYLKDETGILYLKSDLDMKMEIVRGNMIRRANHMNR